MRRLSSVWIGVIFCLFFLPFPASGQLSLGQYQDEAPLRSWNIIGTSTASTLGLGGTSLASPSDCSVSLYNPALLNSLPSVCFTLNGSLTQVSLFKYGILNTGVVTTSENINLLLYAADFAGISFKFKGWAVSLSASLLEVYNRPSIQSEYEYKGNLYYSLNFTQEGNLKNLNFSLSRKLYSNFSAGIGLNFIYGSLSKKVKEKWYETGVTVTDHKSHNFKGFYLNGGVHWNISSKFSLGFMFRTPYTKQAQSQSLLRFNSPAGNTDIQIKASAENSYAQPLIMGVGANYNFSERFKANLDINYFHWSSYKVNYFHEQLKREFEDTVKIGSGLEYLYEFPIFHKTLNIPLRSGFLYDPQPPHHPSSSYVYFTVGTGVYWGNFYLDLGGIWGIERGSGDNLSARKVALSLSFKK